MVGPLSSRGCSTEAGNPPNNCRGCCGSFQRPQISRLRSTLPQKHFLFRKLIILSVLHLTQCVGFFPLMPYIASGAPHLHFLFITLIISSVLHSIQQVLFPPIIPNDGSLFPHTHLLFVQIIPFSICSLHLNLFFFPGKLKEALLSHTSHLPLRKFLIPFLFIFANSLLRFCILFILFLYYLFCSR